ncbi:MAG TPA: PH domain-containing protein [Gemmatimonadales bacterium]|nr:PH domain-containing protein [Gemmatimonadales bacterium]
MGYVEQHLLSGEKVMYRAHLHWTIFFWPAFITLVGLVLLVLFSQNYIVGLIATGVGLLSSIPSLIRYLSSEFAVTNKRVIVKVGLIQRDSSETLLSKVEAIQVDQTIPGRMLNFGTITITGTGGTKESFPRIAAPMEFRRQVQAQIVDMEDRRVGQGSAAPALAEPRDERECPYCAEKILKKAKVCRFCGREVAAVE